MGDAAKKRANFGRDEFRNLIGDGLSERLTRPAYQKGTKKKDVADMTEHETAAFLTSKQQQKNKNVVRHRDTTRQRNYQSLLDEQLSSLHDKEQHYGRQRKKSATSTKNRATTAQSDEDEEKEPSLVQAKVRRVKAAPVVLELGSKKRSQQIKDEESSSSSSEDEQRRPKEDESSSSDDDSEAERRRARLLERRRRQQQQTVPSKENVSSAPLEKELPSVSIPPTTAQPPQPQKQIGSSSSSDSSSGSDDDSSSDSSSEEEEEELAPVVRPTFVPKHKRGIVQQVETEERRKMVQLEKSKEYQERRKKESRALVQEAVGTTTQVAEPENGMETITGAQNAIPNDEDEENDIQARHSWELRELERLLEDWDAQQARQREQAEYERRQKMTDEERIKEDGDRKRPGDRDDAQYQQKFFHRGAFYMDESEWDGTDVRRKAAQYAQAATGSDKIDKSMLPKVMRVKNFGRANQSRYRGLAAEDTTDKQLDMLPLPKKK